MGIRPINCECELKILQNIDDLKRPFYVAPNSAMHENAQLSIYRNKVLYCLKSISIIENYEFKTMKLLTKNDYYTYYIHVY